MHTYTIDWQPDYISWAVDNKVQRTTFRNETYNSTTGQYHFPQSPSRIQLSLWPAGLPKNGQGTIDWAGGEISWNSPYMQNGYYYAMVKDITVECYNPPSGYQNHGSDVYYYTSTAGTNDTIATGKNSTILASFYSTGNKPKFDPNASKSSSSATGTKTSSATASASTSAEVGTIPGISGAGSHGDSSSPSSGDSGSSGSSGFSNPDTSNAASGASPSSTSNVYGSNSFSQGSTSSSGSGTNDGSRVVAGSLVALVAFFAAAMML